MAGNADGRQIHSVEKACNILDLLHEQNGAGITELSDRLGISKGTVHTHLNTLRRHEYVVKQDQTYYVSLKFLEMGETAKKRDPVYGVAKDRLDALVTEHSNLRAQLIVEEHGLGVYRYIARGSNSIDTASQLGERSYLHYTAAGKAILAELPEERVDEIVDRHGLERRTEETITSRDALAEELEDVREQGVAFNDEEKKRGVCGIGAAVKTGDADVLGSVSVAGPSSLIKEESSGELADTVANIANVIRINTQVENTKRNA